MIHPFIAYPLSELETAHLRVKVCTNKLILQVFFAYTEEMYCSKRVVFFAPYSAPEQEFEIKFDQRNILYKLCQDGYFPNTEVIHVLYQFASNSNTS